MKKLLSLFACLLLSAETATAGQTFLFAEYEQLSYGGFPYSADKEYALYEGTSKDGVEVGHSTGSGFVTASSYAKANAGVVKTAAATATGVLAYGSSRAFAGWRTTFIIDAPGKTGQHGTVSFGNRYEFDTKLTLFPYGEGNDADVAASFHTYMIAGGGLGAKSLEYYSNTYADNGGGFKVESGQINENGDQVGVTPNIHALDIDFIFGQEIFVEVQMWTMCQAQVLDRIDNDFASCWMDASNSSYWDGIYRVEQNGALIEDYVLDSDFDWRNAVSPVIVPPSEVPEPPSIFLLLAGIYLIRLTSHRAQSRE